MNYFLPFLVPYRVQTESDTNEQVQVAQVGSIKTKVLQDLLA